MVSLTCRNGQLGRGKGSGVNLWGSCRAFERGKKRRPVFLDVLSKHDARRVLESKLSSRDYRYETVMLIWRMDMSTSWEAKAEASADPASRNHVRLGRPDFEPRTWVRQ